MQPFREIAIESVFDGVISPPSEFLGDQTPSGTVDAVLLDNLNILFLGPLGLAHIRIQLVVPALPALLPLAPREMFCDL